jgi:hypothetical protein
MTTEITLTHQAARPDIRRNERYMVHVVNFSAVRHTPRHTDFHEDPIPLTNLTVRVNLPLNAGKARMVVAGKDLRSYRTDGGGVEFLVPKVHIHEVVSLEVT